MTETEKIKYAKSFIDKLANGINPIDDNPIPKDDIVNNVRITRCLFYVSDILRKVIENGYSTGKKKQKNAFTITAEQLMNFEFSDKPIPISEITKRINELIDSEGCKKLNYLKITDWLIEIGMLQIVTKASGKAFKQPTEQGKGMGISTEFRMGVHGEYEVTLYNREAQQFIIDNLEAIIVP